MGKTGDREKGKKSPQKVARKQMERENTEKVGSKKWRGKEKQIH